MNTSAARKRAEPPRGLAGLGRRRADASELETCFPQRAQTALNYLKATASVAGSKNANSNGSGSSEKTGAAARKPPGANTRTHRRGGRARPPAPRSQPPPPAAGPAHGVALRPRPSGRSIAPARRAGLRVLSARLHTPAALPWRRGRAANRLGLGLQRRAAPAPRPGRRREPGARVTAARAGGPKVGGGDPECWGDSGGRGARGGRGGPRVRGRRWGRAAGGARPQAGGRGLGSGRSEARRDGGEGRLRMLPRVGSPGIPFPLVQGPPDARSTEAAPAAG